VPLYRVYQIPAVDPGFSLAEYDRPMTAEEQATFDLYRQAGQAIKWHQAEESQAVSGVKQERTDTSPPPLTAKDIAWVDANQETIALALKASQGKLFIPLNRKIEPMEMRWQVLPELLLMSAARQEESGNLDEALERYLAALRVSTQLINCNLLNGLWFQDSVFARLASWAVRPQQTPARLLTAARQLEQLPRISQRRAVVREYVDTHATLSSVDGFLERLSHRWPNTQVPTLTMIWVHLPWDRTRALRLLNVLTRSELDVLREAEERDREDRPIWWPWWLVRQSHERDFFPYVLRTQICLPPFSANIGSNAGIWMVRWSTRTECLRRATRLLLALEAWKLQHGALPETLDQLVGPCLDRLPVDPYSGKPFRYFRNGLGVPLRYPWLPYTFWGPHDPTVAAHVPFFWSLGEHVEYAEQRALGREVWSKNEVVLQRYMVVSENGRSPHGPYSEYELWNSGWPFRIPDAAPRK
jgi:hypothetical protein